MAIFRLISEDVADENGVIYTVYGAEAVRRSDLKVLITVNDIFFCRNKAEDFINTCNSIHLDPEQLLNFAQDVIDR